MNKWVKVLLLVPVKVVLGTAVLAAIWLHQNPEDLRGALQRIAAERLGQSLTVGTIKPTMTWTGGLALEITDVRLGQANAPWLAVPQALVHFGINALWNHTAPALRRVTAAQGGTLQLGARTVQLTQLDLRHRPGGSLKLDAAGAADGQAYGVKLTARPASDGRQPVKLALRMNDAVWLLQAAYVHAGAQHRLDDAALSFNGQTATGEATLTWNPRPRLHVVLRAATLDWSPKTAPGITPLFSRAPLPWDALAAFDFDGTLTVDQLQRAGRALGPLYVQAAQDGGALALTAIAQPLGAAQPIVLQGALGNRHLAVRLAAPRLDPTLWLGNSLLQSPASLTVSLAGTGDSLHEIAASAAGTVDFTAQPGTLNLGLLPDGARRALIAVLGRQRVERAALACLQAHATVQQGRAVIGTADKGALGLDSDLVAASGAGTVDLGTEQVALRLVVAPKVEGLEKAVVPLQLKGALAALDLTADLSGAIGQIAGQAAQKAADTFLTARVGLLAAQALTGRDLTASSNAVTLPPNPCLAPQPVDASADALATLLDPAAIPTGLPPDLAAKLRLAQQWLQVYLGQRAQVRLPAAVTP